MASSPCGVMTHSSSPASSVQRCSRGTRWESMFLPGLFKVMHHSLSRLLCPGRCLIHLGFFFKKLDALTPKAISVVSFSVHSHFGRHPKQYINFLYQSVSIILVFIFYCFGSSSCALRQRMVPSLHLLAFVQRTPGPSLCLE